MSNPNVCIYRDDDDVMTTAAAISACLSYSSISLARFSSPVVCVVLLLMKHVMWLCLAFHILNEEVMQVVPHTRTNEEMFSLLIHAGGVASYS
jgi:hypothetical protein